MPYASQRWPGRFFVGLGRALYIGPAFDTTLHSHHAIQVCVGLDRSFRLRYGPRTPWSRYEGIVISSDQPHELATSGDAVALFYMEPEGHDGRTLHAATLRTPIKALPGALVSALRTAIAECAGSELDAAGAARLFDDVMERLGLAAIARHRLDARVAAAVRVLRTARGNYPPSRGLARDVGLSASHFRHLFVDQIGMSFRRYTLWLRLNAAFDEVLKGASFTTAAHAAGFADSAHLSRTCRRMFGIVPSAAPRITRLRSVAR